MNVRTHFLVKELLTLPGDQLREAIEKLQAGLDARDGLVTHDITYTEGAYGWQGVCSCDWGVWHSGSNADAVNAGLKHLAAMR